MRNYPELKFTGLLLAIVALFGPARQCIGDSNSRNAAPPTLSWSPYAEVSRGQHSRVLQRIATAVDGSGAVSYRTNSYTELATGMSVRSNGQWVAASEAIQITPYGGAATNAQHQVYFNANINAAGAISVALPDGLQLRSTPMFLAYSDGASYALIAEIQDSIGELLDTGNQVMYTNAFGSLASVRYDFRINGLEQNVILLQQPPPPANYGLGGDGGVVRLQVWTEFNGTAEFQRQPRSTDGGGLTNEDMNFSSMHMGRGSAFSLGSNHVRIPVSKHWEVVQGRSFLVEEVPLEAIAAQLQDLPSPQSPGSGSADPGTSPPSGGHRLGSLRPSKPYPILPARRMVPQKIRPLQIASTRPTDKGFLLDYLLFNSTQTNYVFRSDVTYLIFSGVNIYGGTTFEGGTVLKFLTGGSSLNMLYGPTAPGIIWQGGPYRPVICTAKDDDTVGQPIVGTTGIPTNYYGSISILAATNIPVLAGLRVSYLNTGFEFTSTRVNLYDAQFIHCQVGVNASSGSTLLLGNALFANTATNLIVGAGATANAENVTFAGSSYLAAGPSSMSGSVLTLTNCVLVNVTNAFSGLFFHTNGNYNGLYNTPTNAIYGATTFTNLSYPFQAVGAGNYYLNADCNFLGAGTNNIDAYLLAGLRQKTTYAPTTIYTNTFTNAITLDPIAWRDTGSSPALGFHYYPVDYLVSQCCISNATLSLTNGVALAYYSDRGIWLQNGSQLISQGAPTDRNYLVYYNAVQEQATNLWTGVVASNAVYNAMAVNTYQATITQNPNVFLRFTTLACPQGAQYALNSVYTNTSGAGAISNLTLRDCEFYCAGAGFNLIESSGSGTTTTGLLANNLFYRPNVYVSSSAQITTYNNLFTGTSNHVQFITSGTPSWTNLNNAFDGITASNLDSTFSYNAYLNGAIHGTAQSHDVVTNLSWVSGPLGSYYQPTGSALTNAGNTNAALLGLYHYTTMTNQAPETNSMVDIGYHYIALNSSGLALDTDGDGLPDYIEDASGNGGVDPGETDWLNPDTGYAGFDDGSGNAGTNTLHVPLPGESQLRILTPNILELTLITSLSPNASFPYWNFGQLATNGIPVSTNANGNLNIVLPATNTFYVYDSAQSAPLLVTNVSFRRRPIYAPVNQYDLRIGNYLYLELSNAVSFQLTNTVEVTAPCAQLWPSNVNYIALAHTNRFSPAIHVNQVGYLAAPNMSRTAMVGYYLGSLGEMPILNTNFSIVDADLGVTVYSDFLTNHPDYGFPTNQYYQQVYVADFTSLSSTAINTNDNFKLIVPGLGSSYSFYINDGVAGVIARTHELGLYHERCGTDNSLPYTRFTHAACHTEPAQIPTMAPGFGFVNEDLYNETMPAKSRSPDQTAPALNMVNASLYPFINSGEVDVSLGHHDAGDYSKYMDDMPFLVHYLMFAVDAFPGVSGLINLGVPQNNSTNGDILQEAKWEADAIAKMQDADGGFYYWVYPLNRQYESNVLPDHGDPQVVFPKTVRATAAAVAALAEIASSPTFSHRYTNEAAGYLAQAKKGWNFLQTAANQHGYIGSFQSIRKQPTNAQNHDFPYDLFGWAAAAMYAATGNPTYQEALEAYIPDPNNATNRLNGEACVNGYGCAFRTYAFAALTGRLTTNQIAGNYLDSCLAELKYAAGDPTSGMLAYSQMNAYSTSLPTAAKTTRTGGLISYYYSGDQAFDLAVQYQLETNAANKQLYLNAIIQNFNYELGCNPVNVSYLTGVGWHRQWTIVNQYAENDRRVLPPSGIPLGNIQNGYANGFQNYNPYNSANMSINFGNLTYPTDGSQVSYPLYDRWFDGFNLDTEATTGHSVRSLAVATWLMGMTSTATQTWKYGTAQINGIPATPVQVGQPVVLTVSAVDSFGAGLDLGHARIVWEAAGQEPYLGSTFTFTNVTPGNKWVEVEAQLPDGRRVFGAVEALPVTLYQTPSALAVEDNMVSLYHLQIDPIANPDGLADAKGLEPELSLVGGAVVDPTGFGLRTYGGGEYAAMTFDTGADLYPVAGNTIAISLEAQIYINAITPSSVLQLVSIEKYNAAALEYFIPYGANPAPIIQAGELTNTTQKNTVIVLSNTPTTQALTQGSWHQLFIGADTNGYTVKIDGARLIYPNGNTLTGANGTNFNCFNFTWPQSAAVNMILGNFDGWLRDVVVRSVPNRSLFVNIGATSTNAGFTWNSLVGSSGSGTLSSLTYSNGLLSRASLTATNNSNGTLVTIGGLAAGSYSVSLYGTSFTASQLQAGGANYGGHYATNVPSNDPTGWSGIIYQPVHVTSGATITIILPPASGSVNVLQGLRVSTTVEGNNAPIPNPQTVVLNTQCASNATPITLSAVDLDGDPISYAITTSPTYGTLSFVPGGGSSNLVYTTTSTLPSGGDVFAFTANDGYITSAPCSVQIANSNNVPTALPETAVVAGSGSITLSGQNPGGGSLTSFTITQPPAHGILSGSGTSWNYTAAAGYVGPDSFTFTDSNGSVNSDPATVQVIDLAPASDSLINIAFGATPDLMTGPAAIGQGVYDFWNYPVVIYNSNSQGTWADHLASGTLYFANRTAVSSTTLTANNAAGYGTEASANAMYGQYVYSAGDANLTVSLTNLPAGVYDLYIYGAEANYQVSLGGTTYALQATTNGPITNPTLWQQGLQYVVFPNLPVVSGQALTITALPGAQTVGMLSGLQLLAHGTTYTPLATPQTVVLPSYATTSTITLSGSDPGGHALTYGLVGMPAHGASLSIAPSTGVVTCITSSNYFGPDSFTFTVSNGSAVSAPATVDLIFSTTLLNVDFATRTNHLETSAAALTTSFTNCWNVIGGTNGNATNSLSLAWNASSNAPVGLFLANLASGANNGSGNSMYYDYLYCNGAAGTVTISNLPTGYYDLYLYGSAALYSVAVGSFGYGNQATLDAAPSGAPAWTAGRQFALYRDVAVLGGQFLTVTVWPGSNGVAMISGLQVLATGTNQTPVVLPQSVPLTGAPTNITLGSLGLTSPSYSVLTQPLHGTVAQSGSGNATATYTPTNSYLTADALTFNVPNAEPAAVNFYVAAPLTLINVDFGGPAGVISHETGVAAAGQSTNDYWNFATLASGQSLSNLASLTLASGTGSSVGLLISNLNLAAVAGSGDAMYNDFLYAPKQQTGLVTISGLASNYNYDLYLYGVDAAYQVAVGGLNYGVQSTADATVGNPVAWQEGQQFVVFRNLLVTSGQSIAVTVWPGDNGYAMISGLQVFAANSTNGSHSPVAYASNYFVSGNLSLALTGNDPDGNPLSYSVLGLPTNGVLTGNPPNLVYTPAPNYYGPDSFTFQASDGANISQPATVGLNVGVPVTNSAGASTLVVNVDFANTNANKTGPAATGQGTNDYWNLFATTTTTRTNLLTASGNSFTNSVTLAGLAFAGTDSSPDAMFQNYLYQNSALITPTITLSNLPAGSYDFYLYAIDAGFQLTLNGTNTTTLYTTYGPPPSPATWAAGQQYVAFKGLTIQNPTNVTINIAPGSHFGWDVISGLQIVNNIQPAPIAIPLAVTVAASTSTNLTLSGSDLQGRTLTYTTNTTPQHGTLGLSGNIATYTPNSGYFGPDNFTFSVNNGLASSQAATVALTVLAPATNWLLNLDVVDFTAGQAGAAEGPGAVGLSATDYWNFASLSNSAIITLTNLLLANGSNCAVTMVPYADTWVIGTDASTNAMLSDFLSLSGPSFSKPGCLTFGNLPAGTYSVYVYGVDAAFEVQETFSNVGVASMSYGVKSTDDPAMANPAAWVAGQQYCVFNNITVNVSGNEQLQVYIYPGVGGQGSLSGLQIVKTGPPAAPVAYSWYYYKYFQSSYPTAQNIPLYCTSNNASAQTFFYSTNFYSTIGNIVNDAAAYSLTTSHGVITGAVHGAPQYVPNAGYYGQDYFSYSLSNSASSAWAVQTISVFPHLMNVAFGGGTSTTKTGGAFYAENTNTDYWNFCGTNSGNPGTITSLLFCNSAANAGVSLTVSNATSAGTNGSPDFMFNNFIAAASGTNMSVTFSNLPSFKYNIYVYGVGGKYQCMVNGQSQGGTQYTTFTVPTPASWTNGEYVEFGDVAVTAGQVLSIIALANSNNAQIAGIQLQAENIVTNNFLNTLVSGTNLVVSQAVTFSLNGSDPDHGAYDGNSLEYSVRIAPTNGFLTGTMPVVTYTAMPDTYGPDSFTFSVDNGLNGGLTIPPATVYLNVLVPPTNSSGLTNVVFDVAFGGGTSATKAGLAGIGQSATDHWNYYSNSTLASLINAAGVASSVNLNISNAPNAGTTGSSDLMYGNYLSPASGSAGVTIAGLPSRLYDVRVYGYNASYTMAVDAVNFGTQNTADPNPANNPVAWQAGAQFVLFTNVPVAAGQTMTIGVSSNSTGLSMISGLQIVGIKPDHIPVATPQSVTNSTGSTNVILLSGLNPVSGVLTYRVNNNPTNITLNAIAASPPGSGVISTELFLNSSGVVTPIYQGNSVGVVYITPATTGTYSFTFNVNNGFCDSSNATVNIIVH